MSEAIEIDIAKSIDVGTITLSDLFKNDLTIPDFQRPYEWDEHLVLKLFRDIEDHFFLNETLKTDTSDFYLGSVLLNKHETHKTQIVDGQQRLTTFLILDYLVRPTTSFLKHNQFLFHSNISVKNIVTIKRVIEQRKNDFYFTTEELYLDIISKIRLNLVITSKESIAFQFFDSLNSKGKKLDTINILKSYHLRELKNEDLLQKQIASNFDTLNAKIESNNFKGNKIYSLNNFVTLLWLKHAYWTKGKFSPITKSTLESYFRENSVRYDDNVKCIKLFPSIRNMRNTNVTVGDTTHIYNSTYRESLEVNNFIDFNPMQAVQKGLGFFLSLEKLEHYFDILFVNCRFNGLNKITGLVKGTFNDYFLHLYYVWILGYYVKFEDYRLEEFAFEVEQILGNKFLKLQSVRAESPVVIMRTEFNVLQHIYLNVDPNILLDEVVQFKNKIKVQKIGYYQKEGVSMTTIDKVDYPSHTSRPAYMRRARGVYSQKNDYTNISWRNYKTN
jgi:hypothetical protein